MQNGGAGWETEVERQRQGTVEGRVRKSCLGKEGPGAPAGWTAHVEIDSIRERDVPGAITVAGAGGARGSRERDKMNWRRISKAAKLWSLLARLRSMGLKKLKGNGRPFGSIPQKTCLAWKTDP